jgi:hypothetical protein
MPYATALRATATAVAALLLASAGVSAAPVFWTDWQGVDTLPGTPFGAVGTITTSTSTVTVEYTNLNGVSFYQTGAGSDVDYWGPRTPVNQSPYTSALVDNVPVGTDIIALRFDGDQALQFSEAIANPVFSFVSLNGNGYAFLNQDFDILSYGNGLASPAPGDNSCGHWGCGTVTKNVVDLGGGNFEYQLIGSGEPHGTIRFTGAFSDLAWRSLSDENWNGFTVGVQGTAIEILPEPGTLALLGAALLAVPALRRRKA